MFLTIVIKITLNSFGQFHQNHTERPNKHIEKKWSCLNGWGEFSRGNQTKCAELMKRANASARSFMWILDRHAHNKPLNNNDERQRLWRPISEHDMTQQIGSKFFRICCFFFTQVNSSRQYAYAIMVKLNIWRFIFATSVLILIVYML